MCKRRDRSDIRDIRYMLEINQNLYTMGVDALYLPKDLVPYIRKNMREMNEGKELTDIPPVEKEALYKKVLPVFRRFFYCEGSMSSGEDLYDAFLKHMLNSYTRPSLYYNIRPNNSKEWSGFISTYVDIDIPTTGNYMLEGAKSVLREYLASGKGTMKEKVQRYVVLDTNYNEYDLVACLVPDKTICAYYENGDDEIMIFVCED